MQQHYKNSVHTAHTLLFLANLYENYHDPLLALLIHSVLK